MGTNKISFGTRTDFTALRAGLRSHIRVDLNNLNPSFDSLILNEAMQLIETPPIEPEIESLSLLDFSYAFQVLNNNCSSVAVIDNLLRDYMIPVSLETSLFSRNLLQEFLRTSSAFGLESCSQPFIFNSFTSNMFSTKKLPIACYSNMVYSDINPQLKSVRNLLGFDISGKSYVKKHPVFLINNQVSSLRIPVKILPVIFRNIQRDFNSAFDSCKLNSIEEKLESPQIKSKRHTFFKDRFRAFVGFDRFKGLRSYSIGIDNKLGRQVKLLPSFIITKVVKVISVVNSSGKSFICNIRDSFRVFLHSLKKQFTFRYLNFDSSYRLHIREYIFDLFKCYASASSRNTQRRYALLPQLKQWVSELTIL